MIIRFYLFVAQIILLVSMFCESGLCCAQNRSSDNQTLFSLTQRPYPIQGKNGNLFFFQAVHSLSELRLIDSTIKLDYRVSLEDTEESKSCIEGVAFDENFTRSQVFSLRNGSVVIGIATLFIKPFKNFHKHLYFKREGNELIVQSLSDLYNTEDHPHFLIKVGLVKILPEYRHEGLGKLIVSQILVPIIRDFVLNAPSYTLVLCSAEGDIQNIPTEYFQSRFYDYRLKDSVHIPISDILEQFLGAVNPVAQFTPPMAQKMGLKKLDGIYNFTFGPVFAQVYDKNAIPL